MASTESDASSKSDFITIEDVECNQFWRLMANQLRDVFLVHRDVEEDILKKIIRENFLSYVHVHNAELLEGFVYNVIHTSGKQDLGVRAMEQLVRPEYRMKVRVAIRGLNAYPRTGLVGDAICIVTRLNHNLTEVVALLHARLERNDMGLFSHFVQSNENLFSPAQIERMQEVVEGIHILISVLCV